MASFTDNIQALSTFNPYVQELPVDAMVKVGMQKQQQYNEGVQKIQSSIDNIAGLDIAKDSDKAYLQSRINELGNNLKVFAAGDFSDFQLVNSVNGMTTQLVKDPNIQNAVASTAKLRKEIAFMEEERKAGKASPSNEWDFNSNVSSWLDSTKIGESFNHKYSPYIDVEKKWFEVLKSLHSDLTEQDIPYVMVDGKIDYNKTAAAMQRISKETVSKEKIENALRSSLTPAELNQLSIDGRYTFRGALPAQLAAQSTRQYTDKIKENTATIERLTGFANLNTSRPTDREKALKIIKQLEENNVQLYAQAKEESDYVLSNPEQAKISLYKNGAISQFASSYAWEHNKTNLLDNPIQKQDNWERDFAHKQSELNRLISKDKWDRQMDLANLSVAERKLKLEEDKEKVLQNGLLGSFDVYGGEPTDFGDPLIMADQSLKTMQQNGENIYSELMENIPGLSKTQIRNAVNAYISGDAMKIKEAQSIIPREWRGKVDELVTIRRDIKIANHALETAETASEKAPEVVSLKKELNKEIASMGNFTITTAKGKVVFTPEEMAAYIGKRSVEDGGGGSPIVRFSTPLTAKEKIMENHSFSFSESDNYAKFSTTIGETSKKLDSAKTKAKYTEFIKLNQKYIPKLATIDFSSEGGDIARRKWEGVATSLMSMYDEDFAGIKGGTKYSTADDIETAKGWFSGDDKQKLIYKVFEQGDTKSLVVMNGDKKVILPMKEQEYSQLPIDLSDKYKEVENAQRAQKGKTNISGLFEDGFYAKSYFPNTSFNIKGDLTKGSGRTQFITIRINTPRGVANIPLETAFNSIETSEMYFKSITDQDIINTVLKAPDYVVSPEIKELFKTK